MFAIYRRLFDIAQLTHGHGTHTRTSSERQLYYTDKCFAVCVCVCRADVEPSTFGSHARIICCKKHIILYRGTVYSCVLCCVCVCLVAAHRDGAMCVLCAAHFPISKPGVRTHALVVRSHTHTVGQSVKLPHRSLVHLRGAHKSCSQERALCAMVFFLYGRSLRIATKLYHFAAPRRWCALFDVCVCSAYCYGCNH